MAEETLFSEAGITVTKSLLTTPGKNVSIANVASVSKFVETKYVEVPVTGSKHTLAIVLIVVGVFTLFVLVGVIPFIIGIVMLKKKTEPRVTFYVQIESSGASSTPFSSDNEALVDRIVAAVSRAIAARG